MRSWVALVGIALLALGFAPRAHAQTAGELAADCAPYRHGIVVAPGPGGNSLVEAPGENARSNFCWGAFAMVQQLLVLQQGGAVALYPPKQAKSKICLPLSAQRLQLVKTFITFMDRHRNLGKLDFASAVLLALEQSYPCPGG